MTRSSLLTLTVIGAAIFAATASPATPHPATFRNAQVVGVRLAGPLRVVLTGQITCTPKARFTVYGWVLNQTDGALAKGKTPPKTKPNTRAAAQFKTATTCTGATQPWSLVATSPGTKPIRLTTGPATECITTILRKSHRFTDLKQFCATVPVS
jgi:hypothetical protein